MSHRIEDLMRMSDEQLLNIVRTSRWTVDRNNAQRILNERRAARKDHSDRTQHLVDALQRQVDALTRTNATLANQLQNARDQITTMNRNFTVQMGNVRAEFDRRIQETDRRQQENLRALASRAQQGIKDAKDELRHYFDTQLAQNMELVDQQITETRNALQQEIDATAAHLQGEIDTINSEMNSLRQTLRLRANTESEMLRQAREHQAAVAELLRAVDDFNIHHFRQDERRELNALNERLTANIDAGPASASVAWDNGMQLLHDALVYQQSVLADEREWQLRMTMADEATAQAETLLEMSRKVPVKTSAGDTDVDVDYWTCGDLSRIENNLAEIRRRMEDPSLTVAQLDALQDLALTYRSQITQAVNYALQAFQLSRGRKQLMDHAIRILTDTAEGFNFNHEWSEYFNGDPRLGYRAYLTNADGVRVVITAELTNRDGKDPGNVFRSEILDFGSLVYNAQQAEDYNNALLATLRRNTLVQFGTPTCTERDQVVPDVGQGKKPNWTRPDQAAVGQALGQVGYQAPSDVQTQIQAQRNAAGLPL